MPHSKKHSKKKQPRRLKKFLLLKWLIKAILVSTLFIALLGSIAAFFLFAYYSRDLPDVTEIIKKELRPSVTIRTADGLILAKYGDAKGDTLTYSQIPGYMIEAVVATEDQRFFKHSGIDIWGIIRAQFANLKAGRILQGGSTVTQQLAKIIYLSPERTIKRKLQEFIIAIQLERKFTKEQIITMYLNRVYLGKGNYGIDAAAKFYFGKGAGDLELFEAAILAGMLKAPSKYAPSSNPILAVKRARYVLERMHEEKFITKAQFAEAIPPNIIERGVARGVLNNPYFTDYVLGEVYELIEDNNQDLNVYTTLDVNAQNTLEEIAHKHMSKAGNQYKASQIAGLVMEPTGAIKAMLGGISYASSQYNRAVLARRQPGSAFKFFVYAAALENGIELTDVFEDKPITLPQGPRLPHWTPKNFTNQFLGKMMVERAFALSINTIAVQVSETIGRNKTIEMAHRLGVTSHLQNLPSIALGASEVSLLEMTQALAHIPNNGVQTKAFSIIKIMDADDNLLYEHPEYSSEVVLSSDVVEKMKTMLVASVEYGTAKNAKMPFKIVYGKTGTTQDHRDAWFIGAANNLVTGIWIGNDDNSSMSSRASGGTLPTIIWHDYMEHLGPIPETVLSSDSTPWKSKGLFDTIFGSD